MENENQNKTSLGMQQNIEALLCYLGVWVTGIIFLIIEKENKFVKFHAIQSLITFLALVIIQYIIGWIPFIGGLISTLIWPLQLVLWVLLMYKAYKGEMFKLPVVGEVAEQQANK